MSNDKTDTKEHFSARISSFLVKKIKEKAKKENKSVTAVVEEAFLLYFKDELPGLCRSCRFLNEPADRFCCRCGKPLVEEAWEEYFNNFEAFWWRDEHFERIEKIIAEHAKKKHTSGQDR